MSALAPVLFPAEASAQSKPSYGGGAFLGYAFGQHSGLAWGFELFGNSVTYAVSCNDKPRAMVGGLVQFGFIGSSPHRLTVALIGGRELQRNQPAMTGEIGGTYRYRDDELGLHLGFAEEWFTFNAAFRAEVFLDDYSTVAGVRVLPTYASGEVCDTIVGRPLRDERSGVIVQERGACQSGDARVTGDAAAAGRAWEWDAQTECASVPAFLQLARDLLVHGAPTALVERALDAACDEIAHANLCAAVASSLLDTPIRPTLPRARARPVPPLATLAQETWIDGCLGEGAAAARAERAAEVATHRRAREAQITIARDERRHAELGWDVLRWTLEQGGSEVRAAVREIDVEQRDAAEGECLQRYGQIGALGARAVFERHRRDAARRRRVKLGC